MKPNDSSLVGIETISEEDMMSSSNLARRKAFNPASRGYHAVYRAGVVNHCPGCGRTHWMIGRVSAECAFCSTALPLQESQGSAATGMFWSGTRPNYAELNAA